jgi:hypothetical protein
MGGLAVAGIAAYKRIRGKDGDDAQSEPGYPLAGCGWQLAGQFISQLLLALTTRDGRTVRDRITGTSVVVER